MTARHRLYAPHGHVFAVVDVSSTGGGITRGAEVTATLAPTPQTERRSQHPLLVSIQRPVKCRPRAGR